MKQLIRNEGLLMNQKYALFFKLPLHKDWAFIAYLVLTLLSFFGGTDFVTAAISMYIFSLIWLVPRKILFKPKSTGFNVAQTNQPGFVVSGIAGQNKSRNQEEVTSSQISPIVLENCIELRKGGYQDVVGESNYRKAFEHVAAKKSTGEINAKVVLAREPANKFDKNAVRVHIDGLTLGYLPREDAPEWSRLLDHLDSQGKSALVNARIWWDLEADSEFEPFGSVQLDVAEPKFAVHVNQFPIDSSINIAGSNSYQLSGEQDYLDKIEILLDSGIYDNGAAAWVELRSSKSSEGKKSVVDIYFEGSKIGNLSSATSSKYIPIIERIESSKYGLYAECEVTGNAIAAEARLKVTLPEDFSPEMVSTIKNLSVSKKVSGTPDD
jgi:hypothetical protein